MSTLTFDIVSIFPVFFGGPLSVGMVHQAVKKGLVQVRVHDLRGFAQDRHRTVDDRPFGGGEGMVLKPEPLFSAVESIHATAAGSRRRVVLLSAQGRKFDQRYAFELAGCDQITLICGRYEGVDERVVQHLVTDEVSIGDYILNGGEVAACVVVESVTRLLPEVLNDSRSIANESFAEPAEGKQAEANYVVLDCPHYTRPAEYRGMRVPRVLLSGDHQQIRQCRRRWSLEKTLKNRPDLINYGALSREDRTLLGTDSSAQS
ncbi:MAG: tRNA (guanosine(37)-N1)-methyltransferase TrmD [Acidobacteriota bacterium]